VIHIKCFAHMANVALANFVDSWMSRSLLRWTWRLIVEFWHPYWSCVLCVIMSYNAFESVFLEKNKTFMCKASYLTVDDRFIIDKIANMRADD
jgi:hypothetical protein